MGCLYEFGHDTSSDTLGDRMKLGDKVMGQVWDQLSDQLREQIWDQVRGQIMYQVLDQVWGQVEEGIT